MWHVPHSYSLQNVAVQEDYDSLLSISVERSCPPCTRCVGLAGYKNSVNALLLDLVARSFCVIYFMCSLSLLSFYMALFCGAEVCELIGRLALSHCRALPTDRNNNDNNNNNNNNNTDQ